MYNLHLSAEQLEFRDTLRDFVEREIKPVALHPDRLQPFEKPLLADLLEKASQMGLRALALPEDAGGAGADTQTISIVLEELAAGDVDIAAALAQTALLAREIFTPDMSPETREHLAKFIDDDRFHLALAGAQAEAVGWSYHRPFAEGARFPLTAVKQGSDWVIEGTVPFVANAPVAKLFAVVARTSDEKGGAQSARTFLVPRDTAGLAVGETIRAIGGTASGGAPGIRWHHGPGASVTFRACRVSAARLLSKAAAGPLAGGAAALRVDPPLAALNLGVGRAAYEAAVAYTKIRRQGGRNIIEHQSIGGKLADCAMKLELARTMIWKAAWAADHPEAIADRSLPALPLHAMARIYTAEAVHEVTLLAAECFGGMGVMRDMPLQKYVHDGMVFLHSEETDAASKLAIAEAVAGYERSQAA